jgi:hypothetical protein
MTNKDTGQDRYGQNGIAGGKHKETDGQAGYRKSEKNGDPKSKQDSNPGSTHKDAEESTKDIPKTG